MKKIAMMMALAACVGLNANAQITTGESTSKVIKLGNRAQQGDFGLLFGGVVDFTNLSADDFDNVSAKVNYMPLVNFKYMATDRLELRLGVDFNKKKDFSSYKDDSDKYSDRTAQVNNRFLPGLAYHFCPSNVLDVYGGAALPLGWSRTTSSFKDEDGKSQTLSNCFRIGGELFVGAQAYIGNLPLAVGVEYGIGTMAKCGDGKTRIKTPDDKTYSFNGTTADKIKVRNTSIDNQVKLTLTYYFK